MDASERTRLRAMHAKIGALRFEEPDTVVSYDGGEVCALGFFVSTHAALIVGAVNALPTLLDALDAAEREHATDCDLIARQRDILTAVADALKGAPAALSSHSHHDLGEVARRVVSERDDLRAKAGDDHPWGQWAQAFQRERDEARRQRDAAEHEGDDARAEVETLRAALYEARTQRMDAWEDEDLAKARAETAAEKLAAAERELAVLRAQFPPLLAVHDALVAAAALPGAGVSPEEMVAAVRAQAWAEGVEAMRSVLDNALVTLACCAEVDAGLGADRDEEQTTKASAFDRALAMLRAMPAPRAAFIPLPGAEVSQ